MDLLNAASLLQSGAYADLALRCQHKTWPVHRLVLCSQSEWFQNACNGRFQESKRRRHHPV